MFFPLLLCLSLERFFSIEPFLQRKAGFDYYLSQIARLVPSKWQKEPYGLLLFVVPALIFIFFLQLLTYIYFSEISIFLLETIVLLYCLGPETIYHTSFETAQNLFKKAHQGLFSVLFWFVLLGPLGALLFRLLERIEASANHSQSKAIPQKIAPVITPIVGYLNWLPIRFFLGIQAALGKFPEALRYWLDHLLTGWEYHEQLLTESAQITLGFSNQDLLDAKSYQKILSLLDKTLLVFLGVMLVYSVVAIAI